MADSVTLSAAVRESLLSLQNTSQLIKRTQSRLASGLRVESAIDDPVSFFQAKSLSDRAFVNRIFSAYREYRIHADKHRGDFPFFDRQPIISTGHPVPLLVRTERIFVLQRSGMIRHPVKTFHVDKYRSVVRRAGRLQDADNRKLRSV